MKQTLKKYLLIGLAKIRSGNYGKGSQDLRTTIPADLWKRLDSLLGFNRGSGKASTFVGLFVELGLALVSEDQAEVESVAVKVGEMCGGNKELAVMMSKNLSSLNRRVREIVDVHNLRR